MPQASSELRALMGRWFGSEVDDRGPSDLLWSHGFTEYKGTWYPPVPHHNASAEEYLCLTFLVEEWDYDYQLPNLVDQYLYPDSSH